MTFDDLKDLPEPYGFLAFLLRVIGGVGGLVLVALATVESSVYLYETVNPAAGYAVAGAACVFAIGVSLLIETWYRGGGE